MVWCQKYSKQRAEDQLNIENLWFGCFPIPKSTQKNFWAKKKKSIFFEKKKSIFFRKIWIWDFSAKPLHLKMRTFFSINDHTSKWGLHTATQLPGASRASRSIQARLGASRNIWKHTEALRNFLKSWQIMKNHENHEKSWKIRKNHGFWCWTAIANQLPGGSQKTKKTVKSPQKLPKSSGNGFSSSAKHFEVAEIPYGTT